MDFSPAPSKVKIKKPCPSCHQSRLVRSERIFHLSMKGFVYSLFFVPVYFFLIDNGWLSERFVQVVRNVWEVVIVLSLAGIVYFNNLKKTQEYFCRKCGHIQIDTNSPSEKTLKSFAILIMLSVFLFGLGALLFVFYVAKTQGE